MVWKVNEAALSVCFLSQCSSSYWFCLHLFFNIFFCLKLYDKLQDFNKQNFTSKIWIYFLIIALSSNENPELLIKSIILLIHSELPTMNFGCSKTQRRKIHFANSKHTPLNFQSNMQENNSKLNQKSTLYSTYSNNIAWNRSRVDCSLDHHH